jgi:hypothetical protein
VRHRSAEDYKTMKRLRVGSHGDGC